MVASFHLLKKHLALQKLVLKLKSFQAKRNQTSERQASARATSCSLAQIQRPEVRQLRMALSTTKIVPIAQTTPRRPKMMIQGGSELRAVMLSAREMATTQPMDTTRNKTQTRRARSRWRRSSELNSSG